MRLRTPHVITFFLLSFDRRLHAKGGSLLGHTRTALRVFHQSSYGVCATAESCAARFIGVADADSPASH